MVIDNQKNAVWFVLDNPGSTGPILLDRIDARQIGKSLRFITSKKIIEKFENEFGRFFRPFTLSGSGDFHHLSAIYVRQFKEPLAIVSFDNHPDWDIRPPHWSCGAWVNRALENELIQQIAVWGCGSFECRWPWRLLGNHRACRSGRLVVRPWRHEQTDYPEWLQPISRAEWQESFKRFAAALPSRVYVTVDLDCLVSTDAVTNWESGQFSTNDVVWAIQCLREHSTLMGGDLCGVYSPQEYGSGFQRLAGRFDHPPQPHIPSNEIQRINERAIGQIWPVLIGTG
jgi:arginase family enzyme